jgi:hypothetical protein
MANDVAHFPFHKETGRRLIYKAFCATALLVFFQC